MENQFLIRALAAHRALGDACAVANPVDFLKRANDAFCIIEAYAYGSLGIKEDALGHAYFTRKRIEPNTDPETAVEQPLKTVEAEFGAAMDRAVDAANEKTRTLEPPKPIHIKAGLLKRMLAYKDAIDKGVMSPAECRQAEGLPPIAT